MFTGKCLTLYDSTFPFMKTLRFFYAAAVCILAVSCNKVNSDDPQEEYSQVPDYTVTTDGSGNNISKTEFVYKATGYTESEKYYEWDGSDWKLAHTYDYGYEFGSNYSLTRYNKSEGGAMIFDYFYDYYSNGLLGLAEYNDYEDGVLVSSVLQQYSYDIENLYVNSREAYTYDEESEEWNQTELDEYTYGDDGSLQMFLVKKVSGSKTTDYSKTTYTYQGEYVAGTRYYLKEEEGWVLNEKVTNTFDTHGRRSTMKVEFSGSYADKAEHPVTIVNYHYAD